MIRMHVYTKQPQGKQTHETCIIYWTATTWEAQLNTFWKFHRNLCLTCKICKISITWIGNGTGKTLRYDRLRYHILEVHIVITSSSPFMQDIIRSWKWIEVVSLSLGGGGETQNMAKAGTDLAPLLIHRNEVLAAMQHRNPSPWY